MRGLRFGLSLKKWPARKASGQERHPFDSAEPIAYTKTWMFCWLIPWRYRMFQRLWLDYNHKRLVIGTQMVWNNRSILHVVFVFAFWNRIGTKDLDQAISEVIGTFDGVEEISVGLRDCNYIQRIDRLRRITAVPVTTHDYLAYAVYKRAAGRLRLSKCALFLLLVSYWEVVTRILIFCRLFLVDMIFSLMRIESIFFNLFWNVNFSVAAKNNFCPSWIWMIKSDFLLSVIKCESFLQCSVTLGPAR